jgi:hypothetical protein
MDYTQRRIDDKLRAELVGGGTVEDLIAERFGRVEPDERRTKHGIPDELGEELDAMARHFAAGHGR